MTTPDPTPPSAPTPPSLPPSEPDDQRPADAPKVDATEITDDLDPAERDARWMRRWFELGFVAKLATVMTITLLVIGGSAYYAVGTPWGTAMLLDAIVQQTGIRLKYGKGNLRDGLWIYDLTIPSKPPKNYVEVTVDKAYVKIGWRALLHKEVHLREADIGTMVITYKKPPTNQPFNYPRIALPVHLILDNATAKLVRYQQVTRQPIDFKQAKVSDFTWIDTNIKLGYGKLAYNDLFSVDNVKGNIELDKNYPLTAKGNVVIPSLTKVHFDTLDASVTGSLKFLKANVKSRYNQSEVVGTLTAQPMDKNAPFNAKLSWQDIVLPYAKAQNIHLKQGLLVASGVTNNIQLRVNTNLVAKDLPEGHYRARGNVAGKKLTIEQLVANLPQGELVSQGSIDWENRTRIALTNTGRGFKLRGLLPKNVAPYAPETLNGKLGIVYDVATDDAPMHVRANLRQYDGEVVNADIQQARGAHQPYYIDANWQQLIRKNLPNVGDVNSPNGRVKVMYQDAVGTRPARVEVEGKANIIKLNIAPRGDYQFKVSKVADTVDINQLVYQGVAGDLTGQGQLLLANRRRPLSWRINAHTNGLDAKSVIDSVPLRGLKGDIVASGTMLSIRQANGARLTRHNIDISRVDMVGDLVGSDNSRKPLTLIGGGTVGVAMLNNQLNHLAVKFDGKLNAPNVPNGKLKVDIAGTPKQLSINQFSHQGDTGGINAKGSLDLTNGVGWNLNASMKNFDASYFSPKLPRQLTGSVTTDGYWRKNGGYVHITDMDLAGTLNKKALALKGRGNARVDMRDNKLSYLNVKFDGKLDAPNVPNGKLTVDIAGTPKQLTINQFSHQGDTGGINAKGSVDLTNGAGWNINASMKNFDASYFVPSLPSQITGRIVTDGYWRNTGQYIHISDMNLSGTLKNQPLTATGQLTAKLNVPQDIDALRRAFANGNQDQKMAQVRRVVESVNANNVLVQWGKNRITATGNQNQLVTSVDISTLNQLIPQLRGTVKGGVILTQNGNQPFPNMVVDLVGRDIRLPNLVANDVTVKGNIVNLANSPSQLQVNASGLKIANQPLRALQLHFDGTQANHTLAIKTDSTKGQIQATLKGAVDLNKKLWQGALGNGQVGTRYAKLQQLQPAQMLLNWQQPSIQLAAHCWQMVGNTGRLCLKDNLLASGNQGQVNLSLQQIDSQVFSVVMPKDIAWSGTLNGNALVHWKRNTQPTVNVAVYSDNGVFGTAARTPEENPTTIPYQRVSVIARSTNEGLKLRADVKTANGAGNGYLDAIINPYREPKPISGTLVFQDVDLGVFRPFFPAFERLKGNGLVAGKIGGTLTQPKFMGDIEIQDASLGITGVPMRFDNINVLAHVEGDQAKVNGDFVTAGQGRGAIEGTVDWTRELQAKLKLQGTRLLVSQPPMVTAEINPLFDIIVRPTQRYVNIAGVIDVPTATIRPPEANKNIITKSNDVNVIDRRLMGRIDEVLKVSQPWSINADIGVDLGRDVTFQGFGAKLPLAGALHLTQRGQGKMQAEGAVQVAKRSKADIFGQSLDINYAQVKFDGSVTQPTVNIEAVKEVQGITVGVKVRGEANKPEILVFNNGGLSEQQAMNALVTGSINSNTGQNTTAQDFKNRVNNTLAAAGLSYGLSGTRGLTNEIGRAFGLQSLTLDASGSNSDTEINITGYITPDLYIRYGIGVFNSVNTLSVRYQLTRRLYIEGKSAVNKSVDLIYNWRY